MYSKLKKKYYSYLSTSGIKTIKKQYTHVKKMQYIYKNKVKLSSFK